MERSSQNKVYRDELLGHTKLGTLWKKEGNRIQCFSCGHRCWMGEGQDGICKVRSNVGGELRVPWGYVAGTQIDPIEKKPFFHALPGSLALSFGMLGCDYHCSYCQNWITSQALRDPRTSAPPNEVDPKTLIDLAKVAGALVITSTYNEPLITSEWNSHIFKLAKSEGLRTSYVSNGNATSEVLEFLKPDLDFYKVDLKGFDPKHYQMLGGKLETVTSSIEKIYSLGFWLEIVTLLIPGFNDSDGEIRELVKFLSGVSKSIPWHVTGYHEDYKMSGNGSTSVESLIRSAEIGKEAGLEYVYVGNRPGRVGNWENTVCPSCGEELIVRSGFHVLKNNLKNGACPKCQKMIPGVWN